MIQDTADRLTGMVSDDQLYVVTGAAYAGLVAEQLPQMPPDQIVVEPVGRNTAPAIGLACVHLHRRDPDAVLIVLPADHVILDVASFQSALTGAASAASEGYLVTLGIEPAFPHTGYGYIQRGAPVTIPDAKGVELFCVDQFLEKPNRSAAEAFLAEGGYYWNGGIFVSRVDRMLGEIERQLPDVHDALMTIGAALSLEGAQQLERVLAAWDQMPSVSIDHGVMENAERVAVTPLLAGWSDIGSWDALANVLEQDATSNYVAKGDILTIDSSQNIVYSDKSMVALIGVENLVVVDTGDTLLIGDKGQMQRVKEIVEQLREQGRLELI